MSNSEDHSHQLDSGDMLPSSSINSGEVVVDRSKLPHFTSRIAVQKFCCAVSQFSHFKRALVAETGFSGLLHLKLTQKINLKFSASLMSKVDPDTSTLALDDNRRIPITDHGVSDVFGLPHGGRIIPSGNVDLSDACIEFSRLALSVSQKGIHSLKAAESIIGRPIDQSSSKVETDCFKIAFVVFAVGHVLNPCAKHDYTSLDFWPAMVLPAEINTFNWCRFVRENLMKAVRKIKTDIANGNSTVQIVGCHLLLQVIALDKVHMSSCHLTQNITPRIKAFDNENLKKAIESVTQHHGVDTFFAGPDFKLINVPPHGDTQQNVNGTTNPTSYPPNFHTNASMHSLPIPRSASKNRASQPIGPVDFANHMRHKYDKMASDALGILLKEHNSRIMAHINEFRHSTQLAMFTFVDDLVECLSKKCPCCQMSGRNTCFLRERLDLNAASPPSDLSRSIGTCMGAYADTEDSSNLQNRRKRVYVEDSRTNICDSAIGPIINIVNTKHRSDPQLGPLSPPADIIMETSRHITHDDHFDIRSLSHFHRDISASLTQVYSSTEGVIFGQCTEEEIQPKITVFNTFAPDPWSAGNTSSPPPPPGVVKFLAICVTNDSEESKDRTWFNHPDPRVLTLKGQVISTELLGTQALSHEFCTMIVRRLAQIERSRAAKCSCSIWRKFMEPDFATLLISNIEPRFLTSVQREFFTEKNIEKCRLFLLPITLPEGWCCHILDMMKKRIVVIDPRASASSYHHDRIQFHESLSARILGAFFRCVNSFFTDWPCNSIGWSRAFPSYFDDEISSAESGKCVLFAACNFDGEKVILPATKENIRKFSLDLLPELMKTEDNRSNIPRAAIESIRSSLDFCQQ